MPTFKNTKDLFAHIQKSIDKSLTEDVFPKVRDVEQTAIQEDVYDAHPESPDYNRRYYEGGLIADENILISGGKASNGELIVVNVTHPYPYQDNRGRRSTTLEDSTIARLVEEGIFRYNGYGYDYWRDAFPRPFTTGTIRRLKENKTCEEALKKGLRKQGMTVI